MYCQHYILFTVVNDWNNDRAINVLVNNAKSRLITEFSFFLGPKVDDYQLNKNTVKIDFSCLGLFSAGA